MIKKILILTSIIFGVSLLGCNASYSNEIFSYFKLTKEKIIKKLGSNYNIIYTGAEASYEGYEYPEVGITIVFEDDETVCFIECDSKVEFNGAKAGMNFKQIQQKLGKMKIKDSWYETEENKAYMLEYVYGDLILQFLSSQKDGKDSSVTIYKKPLVSSPTQ